MSPAKAQPDLAGRPTEIVQRVRLRYAKRGRLRFTSHRDVARAFERAIRRAGLPMAYSSGFTAHPKLSWAGAAPTGAASEAEYVEVGLAEVRDPAALIRDLDAALPPGIDVLEAVTALPGTGKLADRLDASCWELRLDGVDGHALEKAIAGLMASTAAPVERITKDGRRTVDVRAALVTARLSVGHTADPGVSKRVAAAGCAIMAVVVRQTTPAVRPDDVVAALSAVAGLPAPLSSLATRVAQGGLQEDGSINDPLAKDKAAAVATSAASHER
jgi:radical SAM-linked protein